MDICQSFLNDCTQLEHADLLQHEDHCKPSLKVWSAVPYSRLPSFTPVPAQSSRLQSHSRQSKRKKLVVNVPDSDGGDVDSSSESHRGRHSVRKAMWRNLQELTAVACRSDFWKLIRSWSHPSHHSLPKVSLDAITHTFHDHMNPPKILPDHWDLEARAYAAAAAHALPSRTMDRTAEQTFSRPLTEVDIDEWKREVQRKKKKNRKKARGLDDVGIDDVLRIPSDFLADFFNRCLNALDAPTLWFTTILTAVLKANKPAADPESYRIIGLQSCFLKVLTWLIDRRFREWMEVNNILPPSQNGFREHYRTNNNMFILRTAIDRSRAQGKVLYVAFVDLVNAFPSTDQPTLWSKVSHMGAGGLLVDWLRMMYHKMSYVVKLGPHHSETFQSIIGILAGDSSSPGLWNIYFSDFSVPSHPDDVFLGNQRISHVEQADDIVLFSTSQEGLQEKLDALFIWCQRNSMTVSHEKTKIWIAGPLPATLPSFMVGRHSLTCVSKHKYVGITLCSTDRYLFSLILSICTAVLPVPQTYFQGTLLYQGLESAQIDERFVWGRKLRRHHPTKRRYISLYDHCRSTSDVRLRCLH